MTMKLRNSIKKAIIIMGLSSSIGSMAVVSSNTAVYAKERIQSTEDISFEETIKSFSDLGVLKNILDEYISKNPKSTEKMQDQYLLKCVKTGIFQKTQKNRIASGYMGAKYMPNNYGALNVKEKELAKKHPVQAVKVYVASRNAENRTNFVYGKNGADDNSDAFRHCFWNALMKQSMGEKAAREWSTAHEYKSNGLPKKMDLFNNSVGLSLYVNGKSYSQLSDLVKSKVKSGKCRRIVNRKIVKTNGAGIIR